MAGCDLHSVIFAISAGRQGFPDTLNGATVFDSLVRAWIVATLSRALLVNTVATP